VADDSCARSHTLTAYFTTITSSVKNQVYLAAKQLFRALDLFADTRAPLTPNSTAGLTYMRRSAQAKGIRHDDTTTTPDAAGHWLFDPDQLVSWQDELVDSCHAINEQLGQIQDDLRVNPVGGVAQSLRVVGPASPGCSVSR